MTRDSPAATFVVTDHLSLAERGTFLIGRIVDGTIRPGMLATTDAGDATFTVAGIEFVDEIRAGGVRTALRLRERPAVRQLQATFPVGCVLRLRTP